MALKTKIVDVEGIGQVEIRELSYLEAEPLFDSTDSNMGKSIIKASIYIDGKKAFDNPVLSLSDANRLFTLVDEVLLINGLGATKKK